MLLCPAAVKKELLSQWLGGLFFGLCGGQLFLVMLSTAPISIYIEVIQHLCDSAGLDFFKVYTATGLWCSLFLVLAALGELASVMRFAKRCAISTARASLASSSALSFKLGPFDTSAGRWRSCSGCSSRRR